MDRFFKVMAVLHLVVGFVFWFFAWVAFFSPEAGILTVFVPTMFVAASVCTVGGMMILSCVVGE